MMDDKGFIFTADAALALIVVFVFTGSIVTYTMLPLYQGEDHQHLESLAGSALDQMEQTGILRISAIEYSNGSQSLTTQATNDLNNTLNSLIPSGIGYRLIIGTNPPVTITNNRGLITSNDQVTKVKVISGPQEGWVGRSYYKVEQVNFTTVNQTTVTTVWNFHNWLQNFAPWNNGLNTYKYWGGSSGSPQTNNYPITFYVPSSGTINSAQVLIGSAFQTTHGVPYAYNTDFYLNNNRILSISNKSFNLTNTTVSANNYIYQSSNGYYIFNYLGNISSSNLNIGNNTFYLQYNASQYNAMPWFSILANYSTSISVPQGVLFNSTPFNDIAGIGNPTLGKSYNPNTGIVTNTTGRTVTWAALQTSDYDLSTPFEITNLPGITAASAVGTIENVTLQNNTNLYDAFTVVNAYGGVDGALVQVKNPGGTWQTVFASFNNTNRNDGGYGNLPGIITLHDSTDDPNYNATMDPLRNGTNLVRIIIWDDAESGDYDLVGLKNCYTQIAYSPLPIQWDTFPFNSFQYDSSSSSITYTESKNFVINGNAQSALLFVGVGLNTRSITISVNNSTAHEQLYSGSVPYVLNLTQYDTLGILTNGSLPKSGNYTLNITVTPSKGYESGDMYNDANSLPVPWANSADADIYSGTRIAVLYPQFLQNEWATGYASTPDVAKNNSYNNLTSILDQTFGQGKYDTSLIKTEAIYSGDVPNAIPIRLELWKQ